MVKKSSLSIADTNGMKGWKTIKFSYAFLEAEGFASILAHIEIDFNYEKIKDAVVRLGKWIKEKLSLGVKKTLNYLKNLFKKNINKADQKKFDDSLAMDESIKQKLSKEADILQNNEISQPYLNYTSPKAIQVNYKPTTEIFEAPKDSEGKKKLIFFFQK